MLAFVLPALAHVPLTEMTNVVGLSGGKSTIGLALYHFDNERGTPVPPPDANGFRNETIR